MRQNCSRTDNENKTMRVILADDQPNVRSALRFMLEQDTEIGSVTEVSNYHELLKHLGTCKPDLALVDWELPGSRSTYLIPVLRLFCPDMLILVLSGNPGARKKALNSGADWFASKSGSPEQLLSAIGGCRRKWKASFENAACESGNSSR